MARPVSSTPPSYRLHRRTGQAVVTLNGHDHYLRVYKSPESRAEYDRLVAEYLTHGRRLPIRDGDADSISVTELIALYWRHVYHSPERTRTGQRRGYSRGPRTVGIW